MQRYLFLLVALAAAGLPGAASAQAAGKVYRVGLVVPGAAAAPSSQAVVRGLSDALASLGYTAGRNLILDSRFGEAKLDRLPELIKQLVDAKADVILTRGYPAAGAAKEGAASVPIVAVNAGDPVETGLVASLSRPGGNLTGISDMASELSVKRLDILREAVPGAKSLAILWNADDAGMTTRYRAAAAVAQQLGIALQPLGVREPDDFQGAFSAMLRDKPDGILMVTDNLTVLNRKRVFEFAAAQRIPAIYEFERFPREGGLMSYGPDSKEVLGRVAVLVDRILKGAKPADLPFEQPTRFRFVINKKTADALGMAFSPAVLGRADEIIE